MFVQSLPGTQELYQMAINHLSDGVFLLDRDKNVLVWNDSAQRITGYGRDEILDCASGIHILDYIDRTGAPLVGNGCPFQEALHTGKEQVAELFFRHKRGYRVPVLLKVTAVAEHEEVVAALGVFTDNSIPVQQDNLADSLSKIILQDQLTGLSNRRHMESNMEARLKDFQQKGSKFSVLFINLDDFSSCNQRFGYEAGNQMLITLAESFRTAIRGGDLVGRWAGEEFVGIFETSNTQELRCVAEKIRSVIARTEMAHEGQCVRMTASIGATMAYAGDSAKALMERAISLMHVSKISGKNCSTIG